MSEKSYEQLLNELTSNNPKIRCRAALELAHRGDLAGLDILIQALLNRDWDSCPLYDTVEVLGQFNDKRIIHALIETMQDPSPSHLSMSAMLPLINIGDSEGIEAVAEMMGHWSPIFSLSAAWYIASLGESMLDRLLISLNGTNPVMRARSAYALGQLGSEKAVDALILILTDANSSVRDSAATALGQIGDTRAIQPLVSALQDSDWETRNCAAEALLKLGYSPRAEPLDVLLANLQDANSFVRVQTMDLLERVADPYTIPALLHALKTDDFRGTRLYAAQALGAIGEKSVMPDLLRSLSDEDELVREAVKTALEKLGYQSEPEE